MIEQHYLDDCLLQLRKLKAQADKAMAQVDDTQFFALIDADANSIALIVKHVAGNMRSRWTEFLTTDGEKADRHRDSEFEREAADTREAILARWEEGWAVLFDALSSLQPADLGKTVTIRHEPHTVVQAIQSAGLALLGACRTDRAARKTLRWTELADIEHPENNRKERRIVGSQAHHCSDRVSPTARAAQMHLELAQAPGFFLQPLQLGLTHAAESAFEDELHDLMQLAAIQERAVAAARIDDRA